MRVEVVAMVYRSVAYLEFISSQLRNYSPYPWRILANDPEEQIVRHLEYFDGASTRTTIHRNPDPHELYINRQYRGFNACVVTSKANLVVLVNSDHAFNDRTLPNLVRRWEPDTIPVSRLVERKPQNHVHALEGYDYGTPIEGFDEPGWLQFAGEYEEDRELDGGMYMPVVFERDRFIEAGMYPLGNVGHEGQIVEKIDADKIARYGDAWFFDKLERDYGMRHVTACDSLCYHIREGEKNNV
jgi:hypothetical protein